MNSIAKLENLIESIHADGRPLFIFIKKSRDSKHFCSIKNRCEIVIWKYFSSLKMTRKKATGSKMIQRDSEVRSGFRVERM